MPHQQHDQRREEPDQDAPVVATAGEGDQGRRASRAPVGGTIGVNGEFYEGGKFLPSNPEREKQAPPRHLARGGKAEIGPYQWDRRPADWHAPIYTEIKEFIDHGRLRRDGVAVLRREWDAPEPFGRYLASARSAGYTGSTDGAVMLAEVRALVEAFNRGERWRLVPQAPPGVTLVV